jgi:hypothetical protein
VAGDDRWINDLELADGPACFLPAISKAGGCGMTTVWLTVNGLPLEGEDKGYLYTGMVGGIPYRLFKNKTKGGRWWMRRVGAGKNPLPTEVGKTAAVKDLDLAGAEIYNGYLDWKGNCYSFDEAKGEVACILSMADYKDKAIHPNPKFKNLGVPTTLLRGPDGSFYLTWYYQCYGEGIIFKIPPDRSKAELIAWSHHGTANFDGPGTEAGYFGGPYIRSDILAGGIVPITVIDGNCIRRLKDGRTSKLCVKDGEWHETRDWPETGLGFKGWLPSPDGRTVWALHPGEERNGDARMFRVSPVDFTKPTVGPEFKGGKP